MSHTKVGAFLAVVLEHVKPRRRVLVQERRLAHMRTYNLVQLSITVNIQGSVEESRAVNPNALGSRAHDMIQLMLALGAPDVRSALLWVEGPEF